MTNTVSSKKRVLFVCLGNICRSPTAEGVFVKLVQDAGLAHAFEIDSCGTGGWHAGELAHPETRKTALARGMELTHRARQLKYSDFEEFDVLLAMDKKNQKDMFALITEPEHREKVFLFRDFDTTGKKGEEMPDPYFTGEFDLVFDLCERAGRGLLAHLRSGQ